MYINKHFVKYAVEDKFGKENLITIRSLNQTDIYYNILKNGFKFYRVGPNENYWDIATKLYNDQDLWIYLFYVNTVTPFDLSENDIIIVPNFK